MIHKVKRPADNLITIDEEILCGAPLYIPAFNVDSKTVLILLNNLYNGKMVTIGPSSSGL